MWVRVQSQVGDGRSYRVEVDESATVLDLKKSFLRRSNQDDSDLAHLYFTFDIDTVNDEKATLSSYGITDDSRLTAHYSNLQGRNLQLGARFVDVSNGKGMQSFGFSNRAPVWRTVRSGLFVEGTCTTETCEAYDKDVIMPIGYKRFDLLNDANEENTVCPMCKEFVEPVNCGFSNCWWRFEGVKQEGSGKKKKPVRCSSEWMKVGNEYFYFDPSNSEEVNWRQLVIEVTKTKPT